MSRVGKSSGWETAFGWLVKFVAPATARKWGWEMPVKSSSYADAQRPSAPRSGEPWSPIGRPGPKASARARTRAAEEDAFTEGDGRTARLPVDIASERSSATRNRAQEVVVPELESIVTFFGNRVSVEIPENCCDDFSFEVRRAMLGRGEAAESVTKRTILVGSQSVSGERHAWFTYTAGQLTVRDLGSTNGTRVVAAGGDLEINRGGGTSTQGLPVTVEVGMKKERGVINGVEIEIRGGAGSDEENEPTVALGHDVLAQVAGEARPVASQSAAPRPMTAAPAAKAYPRWPADHPLEVTAVQALVAKQLNARRHMLGVQVSSTRVDGNAAWRIVITPNGDYRASRIICAVPAGVTEADLQTIFTPINRLFVRARLGVHTDWFGSPTAHLHLSWLPGADFERNSSVYQGEATEMAQVAKDGLIMVSNTDMTSFGATIMLGSLGIVGNNLTAVELQNGVLATNQLAIATITFSMPWSGAENARGQVAALASRLVDHLQGRDGRLEQKELAEAGGLREKIERMKG